MHPSKIKPPAGIAGIADLEPFNGCREMFCTRESFYDGTLHGSPKVIFTASAGNDSLWMITVKIPAPGAN